MPPSLIHFAKTLGEINRRLACGRALLPTVAFLMAGPAVARAETGISSPVTIPLEKLTVPDGEGSYTKLGIWAALNGSTNPALFELDTGGTGFFAASGSNTTWWGPGAMTQSGTFTQSYASGLQYTGTIAHTSVSIFKSGTAAAPCVVTRDTVKVGQTMSIVNENGGTVYWTSSSTMGGTPPVDGNFYGDFGLSLQDNPGKGIVNVLAQLTYSNSVQAGFAISMGEQGGASGPTLQIGVTAAQMADYPIQFAINNAMSGTFPGTDIHFYPLQLTTGTTTLQYEGQTYTAEMGISLDTGNQTPVLFDGSIPEIFLQDGRLADGVQVDVQITADDGPLTLLSYLAGSIEGVNRVVVSTPQDPLNISFNLGMPLFEQYDVVFNMETGIVGLRPVPEPSAAVLLGIFGAAMALGRRGSARRG